MVGRIKNDEIENDKESMGNAGSAGILRLFKQ
jgi:hypothetical protein